MNKVVKTMLVTGMSALMAGGCLLSAPMTAKAADKTEIEFWTIDLKGKFSGFFNDIIKNYEKEHKDVKVNWVDLPYADIQSKLITSVAGGKSPDVVNLNTQMALTLAGKGALVDLNKEADDKQKDIYIKDLWESAKIGDKAYAFPWYASPDIMLYNKELFDKAGIEVPKTYTEALKVAKEFKEKTGAYLFTPDELFNLLTMENIPILDKDGKKAAFDNEKSVKLLEELKKYTDEDIIPKTNWGKWDEELKLFESGKLGIISSSGSSIARIKDEAPDVYKNIQVALPLTGDNGLSRNPLMNLVIPSSSKHTKEAIDFANYVTNDENQLAFCKQVSIFPSTKKASEDSFFTSDDKTIEGKASAMSAKASQTSKDFSLGKANQSAIQEAVNKAYEAAIVNGDDIKESLKKSADDVNKILEEDSNN